MTLASTASILFRVATRGFTSICSIDGLSIIVLENAEMTLQSRLMLTLGPPL